MKSLRFVIFVQVVFILSLFTSTAQTKNDTVSKFEAGIDFIRFNRSWIYYSDQLQPTDGSAYAFDLIPSLFLKLRSGKQSFRFKYEFFKKPYSFVDNSIDTYHQIDGDLIEHRISTGYERYLYDRKFKLYCLIDCGAAFSDFKGLYSYNNIDYLLLTDPFNIKGITIFIQPGFGIEFKLYKRLFVNFESAIWLGKGYDKDDNHNINPDFRYIPRPISLFGLSYVIK